MTVSWSGLRRIKFTFNIEVPVEQRTFGRQDDDEHTKLIEFLIDGPGGEIIERVEIFQRYPSEDD